MEIVPILASLRRNKIGAALIGLQIALTLAIVCNTLSIIQQRLQMMSRPTGMDEPNIFTFHNTLPGGQGKDIYPRLDADLAVLRSMPGVIDAVNSSCPLGGWGGNIVVTRKSDDKGPGIWAGQYAVDDHALAAFGARLIAGRWFRHEEILNMDENSKSLFPPPVIVITASLAKSLFPEGDAIGKSVYFIGKGPVRIIGILDRFQTSFAGSSWNEAFIENSVLFPIRYPAAVQPFVVRTKPGQRDAVMKALPGRLFALNRNRVIEDVLPFTEVRARMYNFYRAVNWILGAVCLLLLVVTALGIVGLTTYWVGQRGRQIGIRRALGARRIDILRYFHTENLLIAGAGAVLGIALGVAGNLWLAQSLQLTRMSVEFVSLGALIVLGLSQAAVLWPALKAASVPPALATRGA